MIPLKRTVQVGERARQIFAVMERKMAQNPARRERIKDEGFRERQKAAIEHSVGDLADHALQIGIQMPSGAQKTLSKRLLQFAGNKSLAHVPFADPRMLAAQRETILDIYRVLTSGGISPDNAGQMASGLLINFLTYSKHATDTIDMAAIRKSAGNAYHAFGGRPQEIFSHYFLTAADYALWSLRLEPSVARKLNNVLSVYLKKLASFAVSNKPADSISGVLEQMYSGMEKSGLSMEQIELFKGNFSMVLSEMQQIK